jgi:plastocyanin
MRTRLAKTTGVLAAAAAAVALATGGASGASAPIQVSAQDDFFEPAKVKIGQGEKVQWTNDGAEDHTVKFKGEKNKIIAPGETTSKRFKDTGKFQYHCTLHAGMTGTVVAKDVR